MLLFARTCEDINWFKKKEVFIYSIAVDDVEHSKRRRRRPPVEWITEADCDGSRDAMPVSAVLRQHCTAAGFRSVDCSDSPGSPIKMGKSDSSADVCFPRLNPNHRRELLRQTQL